MQETIEAQRAEAAAAPHSESLAPEEVTSPPENARPPVRTD
jgi:hypothetical protein